MSSILSERETTWNENQKIKLKERIEWKLKKASKAKDYTKQLLQNCKSWGGPCTSVDELEKIIKEKPGKQEIIVKNEMAYYAHTHKTDKIARPDLFKLNRISHQEKLENLVILLGDDVHISEATITNLPTNEEVMNVLLNTAMENNAASSLSLNELCIVVWQNSINKYEWYIGYIKEINAEGYVIDHMHQAIKSSALHWKYPKTEDIQTAEKEQIVPCKIIGEWDNSSETRKCLFTLKNMKQICTAFKNM